MESNSELVQAVLVRNDSQAFEVLVLRYERLVWTIAWRVLRDFHATQDATQETFLIAHRQLGELRNPDSIGYWLSRIVLREAQRAYRCRQQTPTVEAVDPAWEPAIPNIAESHDALLVAIGSLPEHERDVVVLRYLNGHSVAEVTELTGRSVGTITKQLSRAMKRLRASLSARV